MNGPLQIETLSNEGGVCELRLTATADAVQALFDRVFEQAVATAQEDSDLRLAEHIPPWQPVSEEVVLKRYRPSIMRSVESSLIDWCTAMAADELDLSFVDQPIAKANGMEQGQPVVVELTCFVVPTIPAAAVEGLKVARHSVAVDDAMLDAAVEELRAAVAVGAPVERKAALGDRVEIDVESTRDGMRLPVGSFTHGFFDLIDGGPQQAIVEQLLGAAAGDQVSFQMQAVGADAAVDVRAKVHSVQALDLPAADDAFAQQHGAESLADLRARLKANLEERLLLVDEGRILTEVAEHVASRVDIPVPEPLTRRRFASELKGLLTAQVQRGIAPNPPSEEEINALYERSKAETEAKTRAALVILGLARTLAIKVTTPEIRTWLAKEASKMGLSREQSSQILQDRVRLDSMRLRLVRSRLVDRLAK